MLKKITCTLAVVALVAFCSATANADTSIEVSVTTNGPVALAPAFAAFHNGSYDTFSTGDMATAGLETLAEVGDTSPIVAEALGTAGVTNAAGFAAGGPFLPNGANTGSMVFSVPDASSSFSFAAMLLPSNDWFIGNGSAIDISSLINAPVGTSITQVFSNAYDAGTEAEDFAFSPGNPIVGINGGSPAGGTVTMDPIALVTGPDPFASFANLLPSGYDTTTIDFTGGPIATVTLRVVPEPTSVALASLGVIGLCGMVRRRRA